MDGAVVPDDGVLIGHDGRHVGLESLAGTGHPIVKEGAFNGVLHKAAVRRVGGLKFEEAIFHV